MGRCASARPSRPVWEAQTLEEEIKLVCRRDATIDDRARERISIARSVFLLGGIEARVVSLATDDNAEFGLVCVKVLKGPLQLFQLILAYLYELTLRGVVNKRSRLDHRTSIRTSETPSRYRITRLGNSPLLRAMYSSKRLMNMSLRTSQLS